MLNEYNFVIYYLIYYCVNENWEAKIMNNIKNNATEQKNVMVLKIFDDFKVKYDLEMFVRFTRL